MRVVIILSISTEHLVSPKSFFPKILSDFFPFVLNSFAVAAVAAGAPARRLIGPAARVLKSIGFFDVFAKFFEVFAKSLEDNGAKKFGNDK